MKKVRLIIYILLLCGFFPAVAQKMASDYFDEGLAFAQKKDYKTAIVDFQYIIKNHPKNELYPQAFYNLGYVYYEDNQYDSAIAIFQKILAGNFNEKQEVGGDIMADPYANYKHRASSILSDIYYDQTKYDSALHYLALSDTVYTYLHFCGNEIAENRIYTAMRYADIYKKMNRPKEAIKALLPIVFQSELADNTKALDELMELMKAEKIENAKKQLDEAMDNMYVKKYTSSSGTTYSYYYFSYLGAEIAVPGGYVSDKKKFDKSAAIEQIKKSEFYKRVEKL